MSTRQTLQNTLVVLLTLAVAYIFIISLRITIILLLAIIIASALRPVIERMIRIGIPRSVAIISTYIVLISGILLLALAILPPIVNQIISYIEHDERLVFRILRAQYWVENLIESLTGNEVNLVQPEQVREAVSSLVQSIRDNAPNLVDDLGNLIADTVLIFVMGAYWLTAHEQVKQFIVQLFHEKYRERVDTVLDNIEYTMGGYVRGVATVASIVGVLNFIGYTVLGVPNALTLAFIVGTTTTIPMIGGHIGGISVVFLTIVTNPTYIFGAFIVYFVVTQFENYYLSPRIMSNYANINPLLVIVYTLIGFILFGITGAIIAVPVMGVVHILITRLIIEPYQSTLDREIITAADITGEEEDHLMVEKV